MSGRVFPGFFCWSGRGRRVWKMRLPGFEDLAPLETFDPEVFVSGDEKEQKICNFMLSLALTYNDLKDLAWAGVNLKDTDHDGMDKKTAYNGQHSGFFYHIDKIICSVINELVDLIKKNVNLFQEPLFVKLLNSLPKDIRNTWASLVDYAEKEKVQDSLLKFIHFIRNKVSYHSDPKAIFAGYNRFFYNGTNTPKMNCYISRGSNMSSTRFYFADAIIEGYIDCLKDRSTCNFREEENKLLSNINNVLHRMVINFISVRGSCFRGVKE